MTISNPNKWKNVQTSELEERNVFMHIFTAKLGWNTEIFVSIFVDIKKRE